MSEISLESATGRHVGEIKEERHGNGTFYLKSGLRYIVSDNYSHIRNFRDIPTEDIDYHKVVDYDLPESADILDLTWMDSNDVFVLEENNQHKNIKELHVNADNLGYSHIPVDPYMFNNLDLVVYGNNENNNTIRRIKDFKTFIDEHIDCIKSIKLEEFSPIIEAVLEICATNSGIEVISEKQNTSHK